MNPSVTEGFDGAADAGLFHPPKSFKQLADPATHMGLAEIAAGIAVTAEQRDRGVTAVDDTGGDLAERLEPVADDLPCDAAEAARLVEAYAAGAGVGEAARIAGLVPVTGARTLHLLGEPIEPLSPTARRVVADWLDARISRSEALAVTGLDEAEFMLGVYLATHDPLPGGREAVAGALAVEGDDPLADARSGVGDLL